MRNHLRLASLDLGTNSTRLLVADTDGLRTETVDRRMSITRLGEGVDETRQLLPAAVERTEAALAAYARVMGPLKPAGVSAAATSVLRDSANGEKFLDAAERLIGARPVVLRGDQEARMSFVGAVSDLDAGEHAAGGEEDDVLVFDIGGGSTELIVGRLPDTGASPLDQEISVRSVDVGCVRMSERFLRKVDPPSPIAVGQMESFLVSRLKPVLDWLLKGREPRIAVGLAGTVTTVSGMTLGLDEYDTDRIHHSRLTRKDVEDVFVRLASVPLKERGDVMGLEPARADIIVGGVAVLRVIMDLAGLEEILVSEKDILDGLVLDLYSKAPR